MLCVMVDWVNSGKAMSFRYTPNKKATRRWLFYLVSHMSTDFIFKSANSFKIKRLIGGDGGSRTPVRQSSAIGSTCLVTSIF